MNNSRYTSLSKKVGNTFNLHCPFFAVTIFLVSLGYRLALRKNGYNQNASSWVTTQPSNLQALVGLIGQNTVNCNLKII